RVADDRNSALSSTIRHRTDTAAVSPIHGDAGNAASTTADWAASRSRFRTLSIETRGPPAATVPAMSGTVTCTAPGNRRAGAAASRLRRARWGRPTRRRRPAGQALVVERARLLANGTDLRAWMAETLEMLMAAGGPPRLEWWPADDADAPL